MRANASVAASRPAASSDVVHTRMGNQKRRDTAPEVALRKALWSRGWRYRVDHKVVGRKRRVDLAFTRLGVAVFVDGCFWHGCPHHATTPKANREWWEQKLAANVARDRDTDRALHDAGWAVIRVWEHEDAARAADLVEQVLVSRRHALKAR